ncbi:DUF3576 domain-containing protein [Allosphingosinicella vermicomposti]|uniref:DUF3576 domain-containing protein n=1 Tax=Allosphingosinicella vermicomposti TaxID=614671 RepID=UPI001FDF076B|nr:DUF3576 domain-containing protein [Allosphingosinicella vermicomposti]
MKRAVILGLTMSAAVLVSGCQWVQNDIAKSSDWITRDVNKSFGKDEPTGIEKADLAASQVTTIGVNAYLWKAALDTLSFAAIAQTDSNGGVIVTDWYTNPSNPGERMKITAAILDRDLRADALRVSAARQVSQNGQWVDAPVAAATVQKLEEIILTKARDLRRSAIVN